MLFRSPDVNIGRRDIDIGRGQACSDGRVVVVGVVRRRTEALIVHERVNGGRGVQRAMGRIVPGETWAKPGTVETSPRQEVPGAAPHGVEPRIVAQLHVRSSYAGGLLLKL